MKIIGLYVTFYNNEFHLPDKTITTKQWIDIQKLANLGTKLIIMMMDFYNGKGGFSGFKVEMRKIIDKI